MQLVIRNRCVIATHEDGQNLVDLYPGCEIVSYQGVFQLDLCNLNPDPRSDEQKVSDYRDQRRQIYPPIGDQLDMIYWDQVNGTTIWQDTVAAVKVQYPKM